MNEDELYRYMHSALKAERKEAKRRAEHAALAAERRRRRSYSEESRELGRVGSLLLFMVGAALMFGVGTGVYLAVTRIDITREPTPREVDPDLPWPCWRDPMYPGDC